MTRTTPMTDSLINSFVVLFIVIDPLGIAPIFAVLTRGASRQHQRIMALRGTGVAAGILLLFFFTGDSLLKFLGISIPAFRIAGGVLLFLLSIDMVVVRQSGLRSATASEQEEAAHRPDVSVFPLAFPLIAGPGAITTVLLMAQSSGDLASSLGTLAVLMVVLALALVTLLSAPLIKGLLGETGVNVISRLLGIMLAALATQYIVDGVRASFPALGAPA